ncbi:ECF transporter S component [Lactobacillus delbrueckii]|uniref:ECF transporter S component n=1 Tax=Lactobacillus delbrueckii TaxID=1584 RepID=UPI0022DF3288|nr:ECF transporter S component [Lactobacillus delbrueckii]
MYDSEARQKTLNLTVSAVFVAILLLEAFIPNVGYITILPGLPAITTIPLTVAVFASLRGPKAGAAFGLVWGLTSLLRAYAAPNGLVTILLFQNPLIALLPRLAAGWAAGLAGQLADKWESRKPLAYALSGLLASAVNTLMVILLSDLVYFSHPQKLALALGAKSGQSLLVILFTALAVNGILEAVFSGLITPLITAPLKKRLKRR